MTVPWRWWMLVLVLALGLRLHTAPLGYNADESVYVQHAWNLAHGDLDLADSSWYIHRIPIYLPAAPVIQLFGIGWASVIAWPLLASLAQVLLAMVLALRLGGRAASVFAGGLIAFLPLDVVSSVHLMPDGMFGAMMSGAVVLWWLGIEDGRANRARGLLVGAGVLLGLAALVRPYAGILGLFLVVDLLVTRRSWRNLLPVVAGGVSVATVYCTAYAIAVGDPFYRLEVVASTYSSGVLAEPARLLHYPKVVLHPTGPFGLYGLAFGCAALAVGARAGRNELRLFAWILIVAGFLQFGSMSLDSWVPILKRNRFLTPLILPACVLLALALARLANLRRGPSVARRFAVAVLLATLALTSLRLVEGTIRHQRPRAEAFERVASLVQQRADRPLYADHWRTAIRLGPYVSFFGGHGFYFGDGDAERMTEGGFDPAGRLAYLSADLDPNALPASLILLDRLDQHAREAGTLGPVGLEPDGPKGRHEALELLFEGGGLELYAFTPAR